MAFKLEAGGDAADGTAQTGAADATTDAKASTPAATAVQKGSRWFDHVEEFDLPLHASLIGYTVQCLMAVSKWESLVDISNRLNSATSNEYASQLLPFIIYAQSTLHGTAATKTAEKRKALEVRV